MSTPTTSPNYSPRHDANADPVGGHCETRRMYRAVLDTCVLVPSLQRDFLLQLAAEEAFAPLWGTGILTELDYVLARLHERRHVMDSDVRRRHLLDQMRRAFPGSEVNAPKDREYHYELSDRRTVTLLTPRCAARRTRSSPMTRAPGSRPPPCSPRQTSRSSPHTSLRSTPSQPTQKPDPSAARHVEAPHRSDPHR